MFDVLTREELDLADEAVYHLGIRLWERRAYPDWRRWLPLRSGEVLDADSFRVATAVLEEIERRAGKPLGELSDAEVECYSRRIHRIVDTRDERERPGLPAGEGERLLEELRRDYGDLRRRVA